MTAKELSEDIEQQFAACPCGNCMAKIDYDCEPPVGRYNNGELRYNACRPVYFYCAIKGKAMNTDEMKGKQCSEVKTNNVGGL